MTLRVSELFYAPQGEGARVGEMSVFIRLQGCSARHACAASGVVCDTEFESGREVEVPELEAEARGFVGAKGHAQAFVAVPGFRHWVVWTGGEPLDQLTPDVVRYFTEQGWRQAIETSGVRPFPATFRAMFDWVAVSPKVAEHILARHFEGEVFPFGQIPTAHVHELRYVRHRGQSLPQPSLTALTYYLSPHSDGLTLNVENVARVIELCGQDPRWRVSVQAHKVWKCL